MGVAATTMGVVLTPSGASDDTTFVQGYLDSERCIAFKGIFPVTSLRVKYNEQVLSGIGSSHHTNLVELSSARSAFKYVGAQWVSGATDAYTILLVEPDASGQAQTGVRIDNIGFYGEGLAARGVSWRSVRGGKVDVFVQSTRDTGFYVGVVPSLAAGFRDPQWTTFDMIEVDQSAIGMGRGVQLDGDAVANTSLNLFPHIFVRYNDNDAVVIGNSDHNLFGMIHCLHSSLTPGHGLVFAGSDVAGQEARYNLVQLASVGLGGCHSEGTDTRTSAAFRNTIQMWDTQGGNNPDPVIGTGSSLFWYSDALPPASLMRTSFPT